MIGGHEKRKVLNPQNRDQPTLYMLTSAAATPLYSATSCTLGAFAPPVPRCASRIYLSNVTNRIWRRTWLRLMDGVRLEGCRRRPTSASPTAAPRRTRRRQLLGVWGRSSISWGRPQFGTEYIRRMRRYRAAEGFGSHGKVPRGTPLVQVC